MLKPGGISVLHTISSQIEEPIEAWIDKYIFPGGYIPSAREVIDVLPEYDFRFLDYENLRMHYAMKSLYECGVFTWQFHRAAFAMGHSTYRKLSFLKAETTIYR